VDSPFRPICTHWINKIQKALDFKKDQFQKDADECMRFFNGPYEFMYGLKYSRASDSFTYTGSEEKAPRPAFAMTVNKAAEMVQLFGPVLYHRNPVRTVNPRKLPEIPPGISQMMAMSMMSQMGVGMGGMMGGGMPPGGMMGGIPQMDPQAMLLMQQQQQQMAMEVDYTRSILLDHYLNFTPTALDLKRECRNMIDEALIKGMGVLWHEVYYPRGAQFKMVGSFHDTVDNLVVDPDVDSLADAKWIARKCVHPVWQVEAEYGLAPGTLKGNLESTDQQVSIAGSPSGEYDRKRGLTNDLICYWKIYSKMGMGSRLSGIDKSAAELDVFGDYIYLAICEHHDFPLNVPEEALMDPEEVTQRLQWETPFWADDAWPFTALSFHWVPKRVWPMSHLKPGLGELKFINWAYSFLAGKIRTACRDLVAVQKSAAEEIKRALVEGTDYELMEIEKAHGTISEVVQFMQHPPFHGDIYKVISAVEDNFEKRVGLTELMYGQTSSQYRSAAEAQVKSDQLRIRPDDMANKVEDTMSDVARKEAFSARWHLDGQDVLPMLGQQGAQIWDQIMVTADPAVLLHQIEYRVEAGSARKPNKDKELADANAAIQTLFTPLYEYAMATGQTQQVNAVLTMWAKAQDIEPAPFLLTAPPMPEPAPTPPVDPNQQAELEVRREEAKAAKKEKA
jgi:hypothetical protein